MQAVLRVLSIVVLAFSLSAAAAASTVSFTPKTSAGLASPQHADLNGDGREDFVSATFNGAAISVQLSTGDGEYAAPVTYTLPGTATVQLITIADFNGDGKADLFVFGATSGSNSAYLYLNNGTGQFTFATEFSSPAINSNIAGLVAADFNHDGKMDVAWVQYPYLIVWFGDGKGQFTDGPRTQVQNAGPLMLGDFDGDGHADLAIGDLVNYSSVEILYGDGTGAFPDSKMLALPVGSDSLPGVADVNSDGRSDIVAATFYPNNPNHISVYYGQSSRAWTANTTIPIAHCAGRNPPLAADVNGDGINDLIVAESDCNNAAQTTHYIGVLTRNANATYNSDRIVYQSSAPDLTVSNLSVIRANADSKPDIAFTQCIAAPCVYNSNLELKVLLNSTSGAFHTCDAPDNFTGIHVCSPATTYMNTAVKFSAGASGQTTMRKMEVWVDGDKLGEERNGFSTYSFFDRTFDINPGTHKVTIFAAGVDNSLVEKSFTLKVE